MDTIERDSMTERQEDSLTTLEHVPISAPFIEQMTQVLTEHGATMTETKHCPNFGQPYNEYTIAFPPGTTRSFGLRMMRSRYFLIQFPDGFQLSGGELWPLHRSEHDTATTVLHLPRELAEEKREHS